MKIKLVILGILAVLSLSLLACSSAAAAESVELSLDDFSSQQDITREITVTAGDSFKITLPSNLTTGFSWSWPPQISDAAVLEMTEHAYVAPESEMMGAAGTEDWTFKALKKGTATISMDYSQPWEGGQKTDWTFKVTVTVK